MHEIVSIQVGQAGNQISNCFWETLANEHSISPDGQLDTSKADQHDRKGVFFSESGRGKYIPRAVCVDLEPATMDAIRGSKFGGIFRPDNFVSGQSGAGNNWAKGYYTEGAELVEPAMDAIRREVEATEALQGFQMVHSLGGGTGSGMGTLLLTKLREEYSDRIISTYSILPSAKVSETVTEPYNTVLALNQLIDNADVTVCLDNEALYNIAERQMHVQQPTHHHLNQLIAQAMSGITTCLRYPGQLNGHMRKLAVNLTPFPRLHFFATSYAPLYASSQRAFQNLSVPELTSQLFNPQNVMTALDPGMGRYLTISTIYRGRISLKEVDDCNAQTFQRNSDMFVDWIPNNFQTSVCDVAAASGNSAVMIANTTAIKEPFRRACSQFEKMYRREAYTHWYTQEGMDTEEFQEAFANLSDLTNEYEQHEMLIGEEAAYEEGYEEIIEE